MSRSRQKKSRLRSILLIINYKTFIVTILAVVSTYLCGYYGIRGDFPLTLVGIAIVFPVVFSIDSAYKRRERILMYLGDFKAHLNSISLAARDWLGTADPELKSRIQQDLILIFSNLRKCCTVADKELEEADENLYKSISELSKTVQIFRSKDMYLGELSRINQYISKLTIDAENIKVIRRYPTPVTLRAYSKVFIFSFPILYGPYFEHMAEAFTPGLEYMMPIMFSFILVSLDNIQEHLENPFDQVGEDDVSFDVEQFTEKIKI